VLLQRLPAPEPDFYPHSRTHPPPPLPFTQFRGKLLTLLKMSKYYDPVSLLDFLLRCPTLFEERVLLYERVGDHRRALELLVKELADHPKAEAYCVEQYNCAWTPSPTPPPSPPPFPTYPPPSPHPCTHPSPATRWHGLGCVHLALVARRAPGASQRTPVLPFAGAPCPVLPHPPSPRSFLCPSPPLPVPPSVAVRGIESDAFVILLRLYLDPELRDDARSDAFRASAMNLLRRHATKVNAMRVMQLVPKSVPLATLMPFLEQVRSTCLGLRVAWGGGA
jgi:hypothetical protein